jgi:hypothetical protein
MKIVSSETGEEFEAVVERASDADLRRVKREKKFLFDWTLYNDYDVYKLRLVGESEILGLMAVGEFPERGFQYVELKTKGMTKKESYAFYKKLRKKYTDEEIAESYLFPTIKSKKQEEKDAREFGAYLTKLRAQRTPEQQWFFRMLPKMTQLKKEMRDYVNVKQNDNGKRFGYFLSKYIEMLEKKNKDFAKDISIKPTELSQLLNHHRNPNIKILIRLEIHSDNNIPAYLWFKVLEKEKEHEIVGNKELRKQEKKYVRNIVKLAS